jgi:hypothetical protein
VARGGHRCKAVIQGTFNVIQRIFNVIQGIFNVIQGTFSVTTDASGASKSTTELSVAPWPKAATAVSSQ